VRFVSHCKRNEIYFSIKSDATGGQCVPLKGIFCLLFVDFDKKKVPKRQERTKDTFLQKLFNDIKQRQTKPSAMPRAFSLFN